MSGKGVKRSARTELSKQHLQEIEEAFALFDTENTGFISTTDLKVVMRALGFEPRKDEIKQLTEDIGGDGRITMDQLVELMAPKLSDKDSRAEIMRAFRLFDDDETGTISFNNIKRVAKELGENINDEELKEMIDEADSSGSGQVTEEDFYRIMKKTCLY